MSLGILHEYTVKKALALLGPAAATMRFKKSIEAAYLTYRNGWDEGASDRDYLDEELTFRESLPRPDAFAIIHKPVFRSDCKMVVDVIEVDGTSHLAAKIDRWIGLGVAIDASHHAGLRLRIMSIHGAIMGEYNELDFVRMAHDEMMKEMAYEDKLTRREKRQRFKRILRRYEKREDR